jgi:hypothetical protein
MIKLLAFFKTVWPIITNKYTWIGLGVLAALFFFVHVKNLEIENANLKAAIVADTAAIKSLTQAQDIIHGDIQNMNELLNKRQVIYTNQSKLNTNLSKIPDTTTDHPFTDPNLLEAARQLRAYQEKGGE